MHPRYFGRTSQANSAVFTVSLALERGGERETGPERSTKALVETWLGCIIWRVWVSNTLQVGTWVPWKIIPAWLLGQVNELLLGEES